MARLKKKIEVGLFIVMKQIKEETTVLHDFGKHPGYRKKPMTHPDNNEVAPNNARDWNDDSAKSCEPFGKKIGSSAPFDNKVVNILVDGVMKNLIKSGIVKEAVDEKDFLKVPNSGGQEFPPTPTDSAMAASPEMMAGPEGIADAGMIPEDPAMGENEYGADFDAGVEADEDTDPEKYIQQLTGKLTQVLRDFDGNNGGNTDTDKFVLGMVLKQCIKNMGQDDRRDMIKKIKETPLPGEENTEEEMEAMNPGNAPGETNGVAPENGGFGLPDTPENDVPPVQECRKFKMTKRQAVKLLESLNGDEDDQKDRSEKKVSNDAKVNSRTKPFIAPSFK